MMGQAKYDYSGNGVSGSNFGQGIVYIDSCVFRHNQVLGASNNFSAIAVRKTTAPTSFSGLQGCGGALYFVGTMLRVQHSIFDANTGVMGGAVAVEQSCTLVSQYIYANKCFVCILITCVEYKATSRPIWLTPRGTPHMRLTTTGNLTVFASVSAMPAHR